jgi:hypothetical protein
MARMTEEEAFMLKGCHMITIDGLSADYLFSN